MSDEALISQLMRETYAHEEKNAASARDVSFELLRKLSSKPLCSLLGEWLTPGLARFTFGSSVVDIPMGHVQAAGWMQPEGAVLANTPLVAVCAELLGEKLNHAYLVLGPDELPWILLWDSQHEHVNVDELVKIFAGETSASEALAA